MTKAMRMLDRWINDLSPIESVSSLAKEIDPHCHVYAYLYSDACRIVFSDGSKVSYSNGRLTQERKHG